MHTDVSGEYSHNLPVSEETRPLEKKDTQMTESQRWTDR